MTSAWTIRARSCTNSSIWSWELGSGHWRDRSTRSNAKDEARWSSFARDSAARMLVSASRNIHLIGFEFNFNGEAFTGRVNSVALCGTSLFLSSCCWLYVDFLDSWYLWSKKFWSKELLILLWVCFDKSTESTAIDSSWGGVGPCFDCCSFSRLPSRFSCSDKVGHASK